MYGDSEKLIGKWFKKTGKRSKIFLSTKFGVKQNYEVDASPEYAKEACEKSLRDLGIEYIDICKSLGTLRKEASCAELRQTTCTCRTPGRQSRILCAVLPNFNRESH